MYVCREVTKMTFQKLLRIALIMTVPLLVMISTASSHPGDEPPDLNSLSDADLKALSVSFERSVCYGTCPAYTVTIHGDGRVEYVGTKNVKESGTREGRVETAKIKILVSEFERAKFFSLSEDYSEGKCRCRVCTDMATAVTELSVKGKTHRVEHYYGCTCAPKALFELEAAIDKSVDTEQWTGDVSKSGPFGTTCFERR